MKIVALFAVAVMFCVTASFTLAADAAKTVTLKGTETCLKCDLKQAEKCCTVLVVKENGKDVVYILKGPEQKADHGAICKSAKENVEITGVVSEKDGKKFITPSKKE
ncbi:MAG TPA: hypothetical protein VFC46_01680 [Humisphaera sp.]|nr:hypothetical protein [Humisphaera sp.]